MEGTGDYKAHDRNSQLELAARSVKVMAAARRKHVHLWVATVAYRITDPTQTHGILDHESLFTPPALGCMICEREYVPGMETTKCTGDPE